jgi:uncharacterized protein (DUF58 family)
MAFRTPQSSSRPGVRSPKLPPPAINPAQLASAQLLAATDDLELIARTVVEGFLHGLHQSPYVGFSVEFASHREYMPGDDLRHINWRLYGRHERLFVKEFDAETNVEVHLIVDASRSMTAEGKWPCAALIAAAIAHLAAHQRDAIGLTLFADGVLEHLRPRGTPDHRMEVLHALARARAHPASQSPRVLHEIAELVPRRGLKVLISDFYFDADALLPAIGHFEHFGHELILFHVLTPLEHHLPVSGPIRFRDMETGEEIVTHSEQIRGEFTAAVTAWQAELQKLAAMHNHDYVPVTTDTPLTSVLRDYFRKRAELY